MKKIGLIQMVTILSSIALTSCIKANKSSSKEASINSSESSANIEYHLYDDINVSKKSFSYINYLLNTSDSILKTKNKSLAFKANEDESLAESESSLSNQEEIPPSLSLEEVLEKFGNPFPANMSLEFDGVEQITCEDGSLAHTLPLFMDYYEIYSSVLFNVQIEDENTFIGNLMGKGNCECIITNSNVESFITLKHENRIYSCIDCGSSPIQGFEVNENIHFTNFGTYKYFKGLYCFKEAELHQENWPIVGENIESGEIICNFGTIDQSTIKRKEFEEARYNWDDLLSIDTPLDEDTSLQ
ncbi:MAG: hypothetical protein MJ217_03065 [Bacilli bacterium]|nr:hypothetical protein [Bacilli bacterium]